MENLHVCPRMTTQGIQSGICRGVTGFIWREVTSCHCAQLRLENSSWNGTFSRHFEIQQCTVALRSRAQTTILCMSSLCKMHNTTLSLCVYVCNVSITSSKTGEQLSFASHPAPHDSNSVRPHYTYSGCPACWIERRTIKPKP